MLQARERSMSAAFEPRTAATIFVECRCEKLREAFYERLEGRFQFEVLYACRQARPQGAYAHEVLPCYGIGGGRLHLHGTATLNRWLRETTGELVFVEPDGAAFIAAIAAAQRGQRVRVWSNDRQIRWRMVGLLQAIGLSMTLETVDRGMERALEEYSAERVQSAAG